MPIVEYSPIGRRAPLSETGTVTLPPAPAKIRILETANRLFYDEGIRSVGIDRLISESEVTKATFYKHYGSKDRLIVEYVRERHSIDKVKIDGIIAEAGGGEAAIRAVLAAIVIAIEAPGFRGCPFINAANEFADVRNPVRSIVIEHRDWYAETITNLFSELGHGLPGDSADEFILARDGAMSGGYAGDPIAAATALQRAVERLLA